MATAIALASVDGTVFPSSRPQGFRPFRVRKRRSKLKPTIRPRKLPRYMICNQFDPSNSYSGFNDLFQGLLSHLPRPVNPLPLAALGFASGLAFSLPDILNLKQKNLKNSKVPELSNLGEWIMFSSPTPFNRFVLLRCPSLLFEDGEFLKDVNDRLVKQERHFVRLDSGKIQLRTGFDGNSDEGNAERVKKPLLEYSRICLRTDDGGVVSLDWPANLDLNEERGLDSTILLIPGSTEGSMGENVRSFAFDCLKKGCFPVVMNPRGCAGSPLTTPRLFSAADSDDVSSAIRFLSRVRPWSTFMSVGWGYGANMLTKYLAVAGEKTPLTAAACIDNPFDLEEAARSCAASNTNSEKLLEGLKDILRSNKELFQGRSKAFDVELALNAESVRDFEAAISMVSYGFDTIEEFYEKSSTRSVVADLKVPVLFIQSDDGNVPLFSIPRGMIAENPFSSLLLCSSSPSDVADNRNFVMSWSQELAVEWLAAVELALLKGRHPLLKDLDVTVNPSTGLTLGDGLTSDEEEIGGVLDVTRSDNLSGYMLSPLKEFSGVDYADLRGMEDEYENGSKDESQDSHASQPEIELVNEESSDEASAEKGQVLQTAQVVMHVLDVTMPGTLKEEDKTKVLHAVGQGETLIKALEDAVPEDVRGRLTSSVNEILQTHGKNLNFDTLNIDKIANISSDLKMKIERKLRRKTNDANKDKDAKTLDQKIPVNDHGDDHSESQEKVGSFDVDDHEAVNRHAVPSSENKVPSSENKVPSSENKVPSSENKVPSSENKVPSSENKVPSSENKDINESQNVNNDKSTLPFEHKENVHHMPDGANLSTTHAKPNDQEEGSTKKESRHENVESVQQEMKQEINSEGDFKNQGPPEDRKMMATSVDEEVSPADPPDTHSSEEHDDDGKKRDDKSFQMNPEQNKPSSDPKSPSFNVSQALDALTDLDDSTQMAVNSVFGVIEDMINQLENKKEVNEAGSLEKPSTDGHPSSVPTDVNSRLETPEDGTSADKVNQPISIIPINKNSSNAPSGSNTTRVVDKGEDHATHEPSTRELSVKTLDGHTNYPSLKVVNAYPWSFHHDYIRRYMKKAKNLDVDTTATLSLDYLPEERQWKLLGQQNCDSSADADCELSNGMDNPSREVEKMGRSSKKHMVIEPSYTVRDSTRQKEQVEELDTSMRLSEDDSKRAKTRDGFSKLTKDVVLHSLKDEVVRRLCMDDTQEIHPDIASELEEVANAVSLAIKQENEHTWSFSPDSSSNNGQFDGGHIIEAISTVVKTTTYLRQILPVGVIVGSSLASLKKFYEVLEDREFQLEEWDTRQDDKDWSNPKRQLLEREASRPPPLDEDGNSFPGQQLNGDRDSTGSDTLEVEENKVGRTGLGAFDRDTVMVGAMTAALGASALLTPEQDVDGTSETGQSQLNSFGKMESIKRSLTGKLEDAAEKPQGNIVTSLAEKAMSVAAPVVPTKEDGELDHDRLVTMLTELGQKGGMLRLVGKLALLWGGIRGAMSLTDRLIKFLRLAERPIAHRILGFVGMVLVLWSPVVLPLMPTLVHNWTTNNTSKVVQFACITGLYAAATLLIVIWGKRIRGYENPLQQYGLDLAAPDKIQEYLVGLAGGIMLVLLIQTANACLGVVKVNWPSSFSASDAGFMTRVRSWGKLLIIVGQGIVTATFISSVEELVYRSWLPEEIGADLGYHRAIILSALAFSFSQRSLLAIPGLWLLSLCLAGIRQRKLGSLYSPIGLRTGVIASCYVLRIEGFFISNPNMPRWLTGTHTFQPFSGAAGLLFSLLLAIVLYPRQPVPKKNQRRTIRE